LRLINLSTSLAFYHVSNLGYKPVEGEALGADIVVGIERASVYDIVLGTDAGMGALRRPVDKSAVVLQEYSLHREMAGPRTVSELIARCGSFAQALTAYGLTPPGT
jgi:hypothetical protein